MCKCEKKKGTGMRKIKEVLRLHAKGKFSFRKIGKSCNLSPSTVSKIVSNAEKYGFSWPLLQNIDYEEVRCKLLGVDTNSFSSSAKLAENSSFQLKMEDIAKELSRKGVTLKLLWEEYSETGKLDYSYSHFCALFNDWQGKNKEPSIRFDYKAGETLFIDWAGQKIAYRDHQTGQEKSAYLFVAVLGASNYTYASVFTDMRLPNWIAAHEEALDYFAGVPEILVPDNTKTAVSNSCNYDPELNPTYRDFAKHYGTVIIPARPKRPQDKAKVEKGVQIAEQRILAALRNYQFLSFDQLKKTVGEKLEELNHRPFSIMEGSRYTLFHELESKALKPLPQDRFEFGKWLRGKVHDDYHIQADSHYYSVPHQYIGHYVDVNLTRDTVQVYLDEQRIAIHKRSFLKGKATTDKAHLAPRHSAYLAQSVDSIRQRAEQVGPNCLLVINALLDNMPRPEMAFRSCQGILRLAKKHTADRAEQACRKAHGVGMCNYRTINNILANHLEDDDLTFQFKATGQHKNIRGKNYYSARKDN